ncbi:MAG: O-antigen ligase family protein [Armatimonadota bacterium]|nr:O-antigen ligase family protein [bacterium]
MRPITRSKATTQKFLQYTQGMLVRMGALRSFLAALYRRLVRILLIVAGLALFVGIELQLANAINAAMFINIFIIISIVIAMMLIIVSPTWGFIFWLFFSPFAKYFIRTFLPIRIGFDMLLLGLLVTAILFRALAHRTRLPKLILPEWLLIASFVYSMVLRNASAIATPAYLSQIILTPLVVYFVAKSAIVKKEHIGWILLAMLLVGLSWTLLGIYEQQSGHSWLSPLVGFDVQAQGESMGSGHRSLGPAGHYYLYGNAIILAILITMHRAGWTRKITSKVLHYSLLPILLLGLYYGYSRAPYLAFAFALLLMLLLVRLSFKRYFVFTAAIVVVVTILLSVWVSDKVLEGRLESSSSSRLAFNATSMNMFKAHPVFGIGLRRYQESVPDYVSSIKHLHRGSAFGVATYWSRPHNEYLLVLAEQGIVGFLLYFGCYITFIITAFRVRSKLDKAGVFGAEFAALVIAFVFGVLLTMITDEFQNWLYMYAIIFVLFAAVVRLGEMAAANKLIVNVDSNDV